MALWMCYSEGRNCELRMWSKDEITGPLYCCSTVSHKVDKKTGREKYKELNHIEGTSPGKEGEHSGTLLWGKHCIECVYEPGCAVNKSRPTL